MHSKIPAWCLLTSIRPQPYFNPISPRNTRRHKPLAFNLSTEESQSEKDSQQGVAVAGSSWQNTCGQAAKLD
jgi:hypothetical protein